MKNVYSLLTFLTTAALVAAAPAPFVQTEATAGLEVPHTTFGRREALVQEFSKKALEIRDALVARNPKKNNDQAQAQAAANGTAAADATQAAKAKKAAKAAKGANAGNAAAGNATQAATGATAKGKKAAKAAKGANAAAGNATQAATAATAKGKASKCTPIPQIQPPKRLQ